MKIIRTIIYDLDWENETDFITNNELYKNEVFDDFFLYNKKDIQEISKFHFKSSLKNNVYNKYEFFPDDLEYNHYNQCIHTINITELTAFVIYGYVYGYYEFDEESIFDLFKFNNTYIIQNLLEKVNNNETTAENSVDWVKRKIKLEDKEKNITINKNIYNKKENGNIGFTYRILGENSTDLKDLALELAIFQTIIDGAKKEQNHYLISNQILYYNYFFFELMFAKNDNDTIIPNEALVNEELYKLFESCKEFNNDVDNIGNRYYYMKKNFVLSINKTQTSLYEKGTEEIDINEYNSTILNAEELIKKYKEKYEGKPFKENELIENINEYKKELKKSYRINIFTTDNDTIN